MAKTKPKANKSKRETRYISTCTALILHPDPARIRDHHIKFYKQQVANLKQANDILKRLEEKDLPAFHRWYAQEFAQDHERLSALQRRYEDLELLYQMAEDYRLLKGGSFAKAYAKVSEAHAAGTLLDLMNEATRQYKEKLKQTKIVKTHGDQELEVDLDFEDEDEDDDDDFEDESEDDDFDDEDDYEANFEDLFREVFGSDGEHGQTTKTSRDNDKHYKNLYRQLVRQLHPDFCPDQTAQEKSLWHDLQEAYEWNDWTRLEEIYRQVNGSSAIGVDLWSIPLSDILEMAYELQAKERLVQETIRREKSTDHWEFEKRRNNPGFLTKLTAKLRRRLNYEIESAQFLVRDFEMQVESWLTPRKRSKPKAKPKNKNKNKTNTKPKTKAKAKVTRAKFVKTSKRPRED